MNESKQGAPGSVRPFVSAGTDPAGSVGTDPAGIMNTGGGVMHTPPRARTRVVCPPCSHTEILKESSCSRTTGARTRVREGGKAPIRDRGAYFRAWRAAKFGGDFDPVSVAVDEAVAAFSSRQPETDRRIWLSVANEIGCDAFRELYHEQKSIVDDCRRRGNPLRAPAAAFQARLNRYTGHGKGGTPLAVQNPSRDAGVKPCPQFINYGHPCQSVECSEALKKLAAEYEHATTQKKRDRLTHEIASVSYKQERDREGAHRRDTDKGRFEASMLSFDEHMAKFDDPSKIATFSDGGKGAESVRNGGVELPEDVLEEALKQLSVRDKAFVRDVLDGKRWGEMGMPKRTFNWKIKKVCSLIAHPLQNPSL